MSNAARRGYSIAAKRVRTGVQSLSCSSSVSVCAITDYAAASIIAGTTSTLPPVSRQLVMTADSRAIASAPPVQSAQLQLDDKPANDTSLDKRTPQLPMWHRQPSL